MAHVLTAVKAFISFVGMKVATGLNLALSINATMALGGSVIAGAALAAKKVLGMLEVSMPKVDTDASRQSTVKSTTEPYKIIYGETLVSGPIFWAGTAGTDNQDLYYAIALAGHEVESITDIHFDNVVIPNADINSGNAAGGAVGGTGTFSPKGGSTIATINKHKGESTQTADSLLTGAFSSKWTSAHRARGIAYIVTKWTLNEDSAETWDKFTPSNIMAKVKGRKIYDPRKDSTSSAYDSSLGVSDHRFTDPSTWDWSDNPALCLADYLTAVDFTDAGSFIVDKDYRIESVGTTDFTAIGAASNTVGVKFTATGAGTGTGKASRPSFGMGIVESKIDWDAVATAADGCDVSVDIPDSATEKRFTANGVVFGTDSHRTNIDKILSAMNGNLTYVNGKYVVRAGIYEAHTVDLDEDDLIDGVSVKTSLERGDRFNTVKGLFLDPDSNNKTVEFPKVQLADALSRDNNEELHKEIALNMTNSSYMAQRIANKLIQLSDQQKVIVFPANMSAVRVSVGDRVRVTIGDLSFSNKVFQCIGWTFNEEGGVNLTLREDASTAYADPLPGAYSTVSATGTITDGFRGVPGPSGLRAVSSEDKVFLDWVNPGNPQDFETIHVFAGTNNDFNHANTVKVGETDGSQFTVESKPGATDGSNFSSTPTPDTRYFWVRAIKFKGTSSEAQSGTHPGTTQGVAVTIAATAVDWGNVAEPTIGLDLTSDTISIVYDSETTQTGQGISQSGIGQGVSVASGGITMTTGGAIKGGQTAYDTGTGFFLGYDSTAHKFSIGNSSSEKLTFDGTNLSVTGDVNATSGSFTGTVTVTAGSTAPTISGTTLAGKGILLKSDGDMLIGDTAGKYLFFDQSAGEFLVNAQVETANFTLDPSATVTGQIEASSVADGSITIADLSQTVWNEIDRRLSGVVGSTVGDYKTAAGNVGSGATNVDLAAFTHASNDITLELNIDDYWSSSNDYSGSALQATLQFQRADDSSFTTNVTDIGSAKTITIYQVDFSYMGGGYVYRVSYDNTETLTGLAAGTYYFRAKFTSAGSAWADDTSVAVNFFANEDGTGATATGGNANTLDTLDSTQFLRSDTDDTFTGDLTVTGTLILQGSIDQYNVTDLNVTDKTITVNSGNTQTLSDGAGLIVDRDEAAAASLLWDETNTEFDLSHDLNLNTNSIRALQLHAGTPATYFVKAESGGGDAISVSGNITASGSVNGTTISAGGNTIVDVSQNLTNIGTITTSQSMASSPYIHHFDVSGDNTVGGGAGIVLQTSVTAGDSSTYGGKIEAVRTSSDDGSADLKFYTSKASNSNGAHQLVLTLDEDKDATFAGDISTSSANLKFTGTGGYVSTTGAYALRLQTNNTEALRLTSSQNAVFAGSISTADEIIVDVPATTGGGTGPDTFALLFKNTSVNYTADALTAYNAATSWDMPDSTSFMASSRPLNASIFAYMAEFNGSVINNRYIQLDDSATHGSGMIQNFFYHYDGAGNTANDFKQPVGKLETWTKYQSGGITELVSITGAGFVQSLGYGINGTTVIDGDRNVTARNVTASDTSTASTPLTIGSSSQTNYTLQRWLTSSHSGNEAYIIAYGADHTAEAGNFAMKNVESGGDLFFELSGGEMMRLSSTGMSVENKIIAGNGISAASPVLLELHNSQSDIDGSGASGHGNFINFKMTDDNATFTPQVQIGMLVKDYSGDGGAPSEGMGNFVVKTGQGSGSSGGGTLTERFRVTEHGQGIFSNEVIVGNASSSDANLTVSSTDAYSGIKFEDPNDNDYIFYRGATNHFYLNSATFSLPGSTLDSGFQFQVNGDAKIAGRHHVSHSESNGFQVTATNSTGDSEFYASRIDFNVSGSDTLTADRNKIALMVDMDSSASGGDTSDEVRLYGVYSDVRTSADADLITAGHFYSRADNFGDGNQVTTIRSLDAQAIAHQDAGLVYYGYGLRGYAIDSTTGTGDVNNIYGVFGNAVSQSTSSVSTPNLYAGYFISQVGAALTNTSSNAIPTVHGVHGEIQIDNKTSAGARFVTNAYVFRAEYDENDSDNEMTVTNSYLFYGNYSGTTATNPWGVYIQDSGVPNYMAGQLRMGTGSRDATSPSFTFSGDEDTGMYRVTTNQLGFSTGGTNRLTLNSSGATFAGTITTTGTNTFKSPAGSGQAVDLDFLSTNTSGFGSTYAIASRIRSVGGGSSNAYHSQLQFYTNDTEDNLDLALTLNPDQSATFSGAISSGAITVKHTDGTHNISLSPTSTGGVINARNSGGTSVVVMDGRGTPFIDVTGNLKTGGTTRIDSSGNATLGTISSGDIAASGLTISKETNTTGTTGTTFLTLTNDVGADISQQQTFIDFTFKDDNANEFPQVRIGAQVGADADANTQILEGKGAFVVYTNDATGSTSGTTTGLAERFRVSYDGDATFGGRLTVNGSAQSSFYAIQLSRSSTGTTTPDIWGTNDTFVIGTSSSTEAVGFSGANATFYGTIASGHQTITTTGTGNGLYVAGGDNGGQIKVGDYLRLAGATTGNSGAISFNANHGGGQTSEWTPDYAGSASAGMFVMRQDGGGVGSVSVYVKNHGTTGTAANLSTFTKVAQFHQDGYFNTPAGLRIGSTEVIDSSRNLTLNSRVTFGYNSHYFEAGTNSISFKASDGTIYGTINNSGIYATGTASNDTPRFTFTGDTDTGLGYIGTNQVGLIAGGSRKFYTTTTNAYFQNLTGGVHMKRLTLGTNPEDAGELFINDTSTTSYTLGLIGTGTRGYTFRGSSSSGNYNLTFENQGTGSFNTTFRGNIYVGNGSSSSPSITFDNDSNTGFYRSTADSINVANGGSFTASLTAHVWDIFQARNESNQLKLYNNRQDAGNVAVSKVSAYNSGAEVAKIEFYRGGGSSSGYVKIATKPINDDNLTDMVQFGGNTDDNYDTVFKGNVTAYGSPSDITLKENIEVIPDALNKVVSFLKGVTFNYKKDGSRSTGLLAQDLQKALPEVVYTATDIDTQEEHLAVRYGNTAGLLVEAIKELKRENDELKEMMKTIMEKINDDD